MKNMIRSKHVYEEIVAELLTMCAERPVTYVVPGHPLVAERTVQLLVEKEREGLIKLEIAGGNSFLDPIFAALRIDPIEGFQLLDGTDMKRDDVTNDTTCSDWTSVRCIRGIRSEIVADGEICL